MVEAEIKSYVLVYSSLRISTAGSQVARQSNSGEPEKARTSGFKFCNGDTNSTADTGQASNKHPLAEMIDQSTKLDIHTSAEMFVRRQIFFSNDFARFACISEIISLQEKAGETPSTMHNKK